MSKRIARPFPFGTLVVNLSGALLLGFLSGLALSPHLALLVGTGFVGSYTTFSTWMLETQRLAEERQVVAGVRQHRRSAWCSGWRRRGCGLSIGAACDRYLKLTTYFGERHARAGPVPRRRAADLYGDETVATSIVLRGIASFGPRHSCAAISR